MNVLTARNRVFFAAVVGLVGMAPCLGLTSIAWAGINWDGGSGTNLWFDPDNWNKPPNLPPTNTDGSRTDAQINIGISGAWNVTGEGVVYDPDNDPGYAAASGYTYPTGSSLVGLGYPDYGPEHLYRLYIGRNVTDGVTNLLTIKSGDLLIESTTILGRSGSTTGNENLGVIVQTGGRVRLPAISLDIAQAESSGWGNGTYDYRGGILEAALDAGSSGIRLGHGGGNDVAGGRGTFIVHNPDSGGYVRAYNFVSASHRGESAFDGLNGNGLPYDPDGVVNGVATSEFHYANGGTRPIQLLQNLTLNNGFQLDTNGTVSSRLDLVLDDAPSVDGNGVPNDLGLFDVNHGEVFGGIIAGSGENGGFFSSVDGLNLYTEGATVSASYGNTRYDWTITYAGDISWTDADNSVVGSVSGIGGVDVVLLGLGSESVDIPGDFDGDGDVDGDDFLVWQQGFPTIYTGDDFLIWQQNFPYPGAGGGSGAVPEPSAIAAALLTLFAGIALRRLRR